MRNLFIVIILCLAPGLFCLCGCKLFTDSPAEESLTITLPVWPPEDSLSSSYPPLSRWHIIIATGEEEQSFYTTGSQVSFSSRKNRPFCLLAWPLTLLDNGKECSYFMPAGYLYTQDSREADWKQGFLAYIMKRLFSEGLSQTLSPVEVEYLISTFNWKKAQDAIDNKISQSDKLFYNPWLLSKAKLLEGISSQVFKASLLNLSGSIALEAPAPNLLSSFIPENSFLACKKQFTILKNTPLLIGDGHKYGIFITYKSAKNMSLEFIYLPIYIEDI